MSKRFLLTVVFFISCLTATAQINKLGLSGGIGYGAIFGDTELKDKLPRFQARGYLRYGFSNIVQVEFGGGIGKIAGESYQTLLYPIDARLLISPFSFEKFNPYFYGGGGFLHYSIEKAPYTSLNPKESGWTTYLPIGAGLQFQLQSQLLFEVSGGYNITSSDSINGVVIDTKNDNYWSVLFGLTATSESGTADPDGDGLTNDQEHELGTDSKKADTDGDGLSDGDEINRYKTDPRKADSDGDGLSDGDEVLKYKTDPNKKDTDGDSLNDSDEITKYKTDPLKADTDGDGLSDGDEVLKYKTDPLKADTDGDGLNDGDEVNRYKTDPLKADTDGGTVNDGAEVANNTDPLNPADDLKKEELKVEVGTSIILDGVVFATGKSDISPESEDVLTKAYNTLKQNPEIEVEIQGHTDNSGKKSSNMKLSIARANAVKDWLVKKGVEEKRISTKGFGSEKPVASNGTTEGKQKNRRIEFFRVK